jgi:ABC-type Zn2+ transport system substrate-binding protein/surface adhesin
MNIVGFEHQPKTESQHEAIEKAMETLGQPGLLFRLPSSAKCHPMSAEVETPLAMHEDHEHSHDHGDKHEHEDHKHADEHDHKHEDHDHSGDTHSDFTAHYHFHCDKISQLDRIEIDLMKQFPATEQIEVQTISPKGQQKIDLTPGKSTVEL